MKHEKKKENLLGISHEFIEFSTCWFSGRSESVLKMHIRYFFLPKFTKQRFGSQFSFIYFLAPISDRIQFRASNRQPLCFLYFPSAVLFYIIYIQNRAYTPLFLLCINIHNYLCKMLVLAIFRATSFFLTNI